MSEQDTREALEVPRRGDLAFGDLMDALAPEGEAAEAGGAGRAEGAPAVQPAADPAVQPAGGGGRAPAADGGAGADGAGAAEAGRAAAAGDGEPAGAAVAGDGQPAGPAEGGAEQPAAPGGEAAPAIDAAVVVPQFADLSKKVEENVLRTYQQRAFADVKKEHGKYFEALEKHPRLLVGTQVPAIGKEGTETLRSSEDAKEWQEAVKSILVQEIEAKAQTGMGESRAFLETVHAAIDLFRNNKDLIPGTKGFDRGLADRFASLAKPYEVRVEGKLQGYSIPVQPLIDSLRSQRAAEPVQKAAESVQKAPPQPPPSDPPQAGIPSKAASGAEKEDFSTLFGTIGLPNLRI